MDPSPGPDDHQQQIKNLQQQLKKALDDQRQQSMHVAEVLQKLTGLTNDTLGKRERELHCQDLRIRQKQRALQLDRQCLDDERHHFAVMREQSMQFAFSSSHSEIFFIEVGGTHFETTSTTLLAHPDCTLACAFRIAIEYNPNKNTIRVDRNPKHFDKILDYMRYSEASLIWLEDTSLSTLQLKQILNEALYYALPGLVREINWALVTKQQRVTNLRDCAWFKWNPSTASSTEYRYETRKDQTQKEPLNFTKFTFSSVLFKDPFSFKGCVLRDAVFKDCTFNAEIYVNEADIEGIRFENCKGNLGPSNTFLTCNTKGKKCIPNSW